MKGKLLSLLIKLRTMLSDEGQDLIEYALVVAVIAFSAVASMKSLTTEIFNIYQDIGEYLNFLIANS